MTIDRNQTTNAPKRRRQLARSPEARENELIGLANDLAEKQIREGKASSQVLTHYLKLGSTSARLEKEKLLREIELLRAKTESYESQKRIEELYAEAMTAIRSYSGKNTPTEDEIGDEFEEQD